MCKTISIKLAKLIMVIVPLLALFTYINKNIIINLENKLPECYFYKSTGYLCPACGNTRCIKALFKGHVLEALEYNITVPMLIIIAGMFYVEAVFYSFGKKVRIFPRSYVLLGVLLGSLPLYYVMRNILPFFTIC